MFMFRKMVMAVLVASIVPALMGTAYSGSDLSSISDKNTDATIVASGVNATTTDFKIEHDDLSGAGDGLPVSKIQAIRKHPKEKTKKPKPPTGLRIIR